MTFFAELERRNVLRVAGLYLVGSWLVTQVASTVLPMFGAPDWLPRSVVVILAIAFIPTLLFSWAFELTPGGLKKESEIDRSQSITPHTGERLHRLMIALVVLALGYFAVDKFVLAPKRIAAAQQAGVHEATAAAAKAQSTTNPRSIAVLPFANLSADKDNAYFAEGIQDEILTRLSKIADLKVISRTSTMRYASAPENLSEIARDLGVANILEGSVQKVGNKVRINVQLIHADTDNHLWAEIYDRELDDIFSIQSEVTTAIAKALQATLTQREQSAVLAMPTSSTPAYEAYLRGLAAKQQGGDLVASYAAARPHFAEAVRLDPDFAEAWRRLIEMQSLLYSNHPEEQTPAALAALEQGAATVGRLQPDSDNAWLALGYYRYRGLLDFAGAAEAFEKAIARAPNNVDAILALAYVERRRGNMTDALTHLSRALQLDPSNPSLHRNMGEFLAAVRRYPEAHAAFDRALVLLPDDPAMLSFKIVTYQSEGNLAAAQKLIDALPASALDSRVMEVRLGQAWLQGRFDDAIGLCTASLGRSGEDALNNKVFQIDCRLNIGRAQRLQGKTAASLASCKQALAVLDASGLPAESVLYLRASVHACLGDKAAAFAELQQAQDLLKGDTKEVPGLELTRAGFHVQFGENDAAIAILKRSLTVPYGTTVALLRLDPDWTPLRNDPRFQALLKQTP